MTIQVGIVGGGQGGLALLQTFARLSSIKVLGIVDINEDAPGIKLAKQLGISCFSDIERLLTLPNLEIVIEATGNEHVKNTILEKRQPSTHIADSSVANLMMYLVESEAVIMEKMDRQVQQISELSVQTYAAVQEISAGAEKLVNVEGVLTEASATALKEVEETDKILKFVQNVTKQTKLLGFNATIEAARAGEFGKGFGVVAEEVKKLAQNSEQFNEQIKQILFNIKQHIQDINQYQGDLSHVSIAQEAASKEVATAMQQLVEQMEDVNKGTTNR